MVPAGGCLQATSPSVTYTVASTAYSGTPSAIPGTIEVEDYDSGGQNSAYYDSDSGNSGSSYRTSEWVDVELNSWTIEVSDGVNSPVSAFFLTLLF